MLNHVLIVIKDNFLQICETFESEKDALYSANFYCDYNNLPKEPLMAGTPNFDPHMKGWVICDQYGYLVVVVIRFVQSQALKIGGTLPNFSTYYGAPSEADRWYRDQYYPLKPVSPYQDIKVPVTPVPVVTPPDPIPAPAPVAIPEPTPYTYAEGDDPFEDSLPGGFNTDGEPILMDYVSLDPYCVAEYKFLSEAERWALFQARTNHRPKQVILLPNVGCFSQTYILQHIKSRSDIGWLMLGQEMDLLAKNLQELRDLVDNEESSDEESSSSSEEEDLD